MKRAHVMPFGAMPLPGEGARFRLWAPAARSAQVQLEGDGDPQRFAMQGTEGGWHECVLDHARPGQRYRYIIDEGTTVPDPASRFQPEDVHGPSELLDPTAFDWPDAGWRGRPWEEVVLYELHVGAFTRAGTYDGVSAKLDRLADLGVTAIELMPLAECPGSRNWGYDGVYPFAPESRYGRPEALKALVAAAHARGLMMFLDVVCNHFGPEGNYLHRTAPAFFTTRRHTPWGAAIDLDGPSSAPVRQFFIHNALYWLEEFNLDGLRLDAVHAIFDDSAPHFLVELADRVRTAVPAGREFHLVLENDNNRPEYLQRDSKGRARWYDAQWNDDFHHILHRLLTGETTGYYGDYVDRPLFRLGRSLTQGFDYQGEPSSYRAGACRGAPSAGLPPTAFVAFLQNHDQVGNRAFGDRLGRLAAPAAVEAALAIFLLAPSIPLLFMGEEWDATEPFPFFCDLGPDLAEAVREGRRRGFAELAEFADPAARARIPDPLAAATFESAILDWAASDRSRHRERRALYQRLLILRREEVIPRLRGIGGQAGRFQLLKNEALLCEWRLGDGARLVLLTATGAKSRPLPAIELPSRLLFSTSPQGGLPNPAPPWFVAWFLDDQGAQP